VGKADELFGEGIEAWGCSGTPADCVKLALSELLDHKPDLVLSGINHGPNLGTDIFCSGTVAAAMEGTLENVPSMAISVASFKWKNFEFAFGQHSGVIDLNKDRYELPRFPINEKYGEIKRFKEVISYLPLQYKIIKPENKFMNDGENPPKMTIEFFEDQKNLENINCFSNEGSKWRKTKIILNDNILNINFSEKFIERRGRINCSLKDENGWRFSGFQFVQN